jgi:hypothetical protein
MFGFGEARKLRPRFMLGMTRVLVKGSTKGFLDSQTERSVVDHPGTMANIIHAATQAGSGPTPIV